MAIRVQEEAKVVSAHQRLTNMRHPVLAGNWLPCASILLFFCLMAVFVVGAFYLLNTNFKPVAETNESGSEQEATATIIPTSPETSGTIVPTTVNPAITFAEGLTVQKIPGLFRSQYGIIVSSPGSQDINRIIQSIDPLTGTPTYEYKNETPEIKQENVKIPFNFDGYSATLSFSVVRQDRRMIPVSKTVEDQPGDGLISQLIPIGKSNRYVMDYGVSLYIVDFDEMAVYKFLPDETDGVTIQDTQAVEFGSWAAEGQISLNSQYLVYQTQRPGQGTDIRLYNFDTGEDRMLADGYSFGSKLIWAAESILFTHESKLYQLRLNGQQKPQYLCDASGIWGGCYPNIIIQADRQKTTWLNVETGTTKDVKIIRRDFSSLFIISPLASPVPCAIMAQHNIDHYEFDLIRFDTGEVIKIAVTETLMENCSFQWLDPMTFLLAGHIDGVENTYLIEISELLDFKYGFDPRPYNLNRIEAELDKGRIYGSWEIFTGAEFLDHFDYTTLAYTPYNVLLAGCDRLDSSLGIILNKVSPADSFEGRYEKLTYPGKGKITFKSLVHHSMVILFTYGDNQEGYFDTSKNEAYFSPYVD